MGKRVGGVYKKYAEYGKENEINMKTQHREKNHRR